MRYTGNYKCECSKCQTDSELAVRDPHVVRLHYAFHPGARVTYESPPGLDFTNELGRFRLLEGVLKFEPREHFASAYEAQLAVEPFLRAWELQGDLNLSHAEYRFAFRDHDTIDRTPPSAGEPRETTLKSFGSDGAIATDRASAHVVRSEYPAPPDRFRMGQEVWDLANRYRAYEEQREPLTSMAYVCLTMIEKMGGNREKAGVLLNVQDKVLSKLGELTEQGDAKTARKVLRRPQRALTRQERAWIEAAVKGLIWQVGEKIGGGTTRRLTTEDLPPL